jgi:hypothetical protein
MMWRGYPWVRVLLVAGGSGLLNWFFIGPLQGLVAALGFTALLTAFFFMGVFRR